MCDQEFHKRVQSALNQRAETERIAQQEKFFKTECQRIENMWKQGKNTAASEALQTLEQEYLSVFTITKNPALIRSMGSVYLTLGKIGKGLDILAKAATLPGFVDTVPGNRILYFFEPIGTSNNAINQAVGRAYLQTCLRYVRTENTINLGYQISDILQAVFQLAVKTGQEAEILNYYRQIIDSSSYLPDYKIRRSVQMLSWIPQYIPPENFTQLLQHVSTQKTELRMSEKLLQVSRLTDALILTAKKYIKERRMQQALLVLDFIDDEMGIDRHAVVSRYVFQAFQKRKLRKQAVKGLYESKKIVNSDS